MNKTYWVITLALMLGAGCQQKPQQQRVIVTQEYFKEGPQLVRISIMDPGGVEQLIHNGIDVIVVEPGYIIARLNQSQAAVIQNLTLPMVPAREAELVQRLIQVVVPEPADIQQLVDIGIDTWEIRGDTVLARAYDNYIRRIRNQGFTVNILEHNAANMLKKIQPEK